MPGFGSTMKSTGILIIIQFLSCTHEENQGKSQKTLSFKIDNNIRNFSLPDDTLPRIISNPASLNVSVNSYASFNCSTENVDSLFWLVNNVIIDGIKNLDEEHTIQQNGSIVIYTIKIQIKPSLDFNLLNNSLITCAGYGLIGSNSIVYSANSYPALLLIQGL